MENVKKFFLFVGKEIWQGNIIVIALTIATYFYIIIPLYQEYLDWRETNFQATTAVGINQQELVERIEAIEKAQQDMQKRKDYGSIKHTDF